MQYPVRLFVLPPTRDSGTPPGPPETFTVEASTLEGIREAVLGEIEGRALKLRALSLGPKYVVLYAEAP